MRKKDERNKKYYDFTRLKRLKIPSWRFIVSFIFGILIVFIGICKAVAFTIHLPQAWSEQVRTMVLIPCLLSYFIVAFIHLTKSGYFIAYYYRYKISYNRDRSQFDDSGNPEGFERQSNQVSININKFVEELKNTNDESWKALIPKDPDILKKQIEQGLRTDLGDFKHDAGPHEIILKDATNKIYELHTYGRLMDSELERLVKAQPEGLAQSAVALYGHFLQLENLESAVKVSENN